MKPWEKISEKLVYDGYRKIARAVFTLPDGSDVTYDIVRGGVVVCTLALTTNNQIILVKQFRPGPEQFYLDLPGGGVEAGENSTEAAARELLEETGYQGTTQHIATTPTDAYASTVRHHYVTTNCVKVAEPVVEKDAAPAEVVLLSLGEFRTHVRQGQFVDIATAYIGLDYLGLL